ncbi:hypothetical protein GCM10009654_03770 [Streptomyces hebeiensis]|uniref:Uncharacterized protein n=1 Tax=Streptomyces hebeiensis TaxID=229486 RepID=A0ABN1UHS6_9ACTN
MGTIRSTGTSAKCAPSTDRNSFSVSAAGATVVGSGTTGPGGSEVTFAAATPRSAVKTAPAPEEAAAPSEEDV